MEDFGKTDIDFISEQAEYLNSLKNKIHNDDNVMLTKDDVNSLDKLAHS